MDFETFLSYFPAKPRDKIKDGYNVLCPSHPDKRPSLSIAQVKDKILLHCKAGCETENIVASLGLEMTDLFTNKNDIKHKIVAEYSYKDELGNLLFQVVRYEPKSFAQRHRNSNGEWVWNLTGVRRVLYHLPEILQETGIIYLTEGEGDADKLWEWGQVATTSPGGANNWRPEYADCLIGKRIVVIPDKDKAGYGYARSVIKSLEGKARETKCIILPGDDVKDFSDWIRRENDIAKLPFLEQDISLLFEIDKPHYQQKEGGIIWQKPGQSIIFKANELAQQRTGIHSRISIYLDYKPLAWTLCNIERAEERIRLANSAYSYLKIKDYTKEDLRRDLDIFCLGLWDYHLSTISPEMMIGDETQDPPTFYLYPYILAEGGSILFSPPGRGKSNTALAWGQSINYGISKLWKVQKAPVLYINLERSAQTLRRRLANVNKILGLPASHPLLTINARGKSLIDVAPIIRKSIKQYDIKLIILDSITRAGLGDLTENQPVNRIIDTLSGLCPTWLALGHTPRACHDEETEVLTAKGWIKFNSWKGEAVLTFRNSNGYSNFEYQKPLAFHKYDHNGQMMVINTPSMNACITPNHRFWIYDHQDKKQWVTASTLPTEARLPFARTIKSHTRISSKVGFDIDNLAELAGMYISEGYSRWGGITLTQRESNHNRIINVLDRLGLEYKIYRCEPKREKDKEIISQIVLTYHKKLYQFLRRECGIGAENKKLPSNWRSWKLSAKQALLDALMWGDGHWFTPRYGVYTTISKQLANDVQILAMTLGYGSAIKQRDNDNRHSIEIWKGRQWRWLIKKRHISTINYQGKVYCFTMPTGFLVTRRRGKTMVSGNSEEHIFGAVMFEAGADIVIQLRSQIVESKLGIGYEIVKANELPHFKQEIYAFEFNKWNLDNIRKARAYEFSEIESKSKTHMLDNIKDFVLDNGEATTAEIEEALGYNRANISTTLNHSGEFVKTRKQGRNQYYGVKI